MSYHNQLSNNQVRNQITRVSILQVFHNIIDSAPIKIKMFQFVQYIDQSFNTVNTRSIS